MHQRRHLSMRHLNLSFYERAGVSAAKDPTNSHHCDEDADGHNSAQIIPTRHAASVKNGYRSKFVQQLRNQVPKHSTTQSSRGRRRCCLKNRLASKTKVTSKTERGPTGPNARWKAAYRASERIRGHEHCKRSGEVIMDHDAAGWCA